MAELDGDRGAVTVDGCGQDHWQGYAAGRSVHCRDTAPLSPSRNRCTDPAPCGRTTTVRHGSGPLSSAPMNDDIPQVFAAAVRRDPTRPLLTWYDDATGERTELSGAPWTTGWRRPPTCSSTVPGWGPATPLRCCCRRTGRPPPCCSAAGRPASPSTRSRPAAGRGAVRRRRPGRARRPAGTPATGTRPGCCRWPCRCARCRPASSTTSSRCAPTATTSGRRTGRSAATAPSPDRSSRATSRVCEEAAGAAAELGIGAGDRVLIDAAAHPDPLDWLLAPLVGGRIDRALRQPRPAQADGPGRRRAGHRHPDLTAAGPAGALARSSNAVRDSGLASAPVAAADVHRRAGEDPLDRHLQLLGRTGCAAPPVPGGSRRGRAAATARHAARARIRPRSASSSVSPSASTTKSSSSPSPSSVVQVHDHRVDDLVAAPRPRSRTRRCPAVRRRG